MNFINDIQKHLLIARRGNSLKKLLNTAAANVSMEERRNKMIKELENNFGIKIESMKTVKFSSDGKVTETIDVYKR